jgi:hypothetical protein
MLMHLAPEILYLILDYLPTPALVSLRSTCKTLLPIPTQRVFSEISLDLTWASLNRELPLIRSIVSDPLCTISPVVTTLYIASLHIRRYSYDYGDEDDYNDGSPLPSVVLMQAILSENLPPCISKLRNLVEVG